MEAVVQAALSTTRTWLLGVFRKGMFQAAPTSSITFTYHQEFRVSRAVAPRTVRVLGIVGLGRPWFPPVSGFRPCHSLAGTGRCSGWWPAGVAFRVRVGAEVMNWVHDFGNGWKSEKKSHLLGKLHRMAPR